MTLAELLADVIHRLEVAQIPYMVTGSVASTYYGEPRATRDLDIVIDPLTETLARFVESLVADGYHVDRDAASGALRERIGRKRRERGAGNRSGDKCTT